MGAVVKQILTRPVQLADQVSKAADEANQFRPECLDLQAKTRKLADLLRQAARACNDLYERPTRRIIDDTEQALEKALSLVDKCRPGSIIRRVFTIIPNAAFRKTSSQLDNSIGDVTWLLRVSAPRSEDNDDYDIGYLGLPPIASNEPILCLIWGQIANLSSGTLEERSDAAASLVSLARDNDRHRKLIIEEGGVPPLLKLVKEGRAEGQENAARAIGLLGRDEECVEHIMSAGVGAIFAKILKDGHMNIQAMVAWAVSELAAHNPKCQDHFAQNNVVRLLVSHLAFETIQEHSKYDIGARLDHNKMPSLQSVVINTKNTKDKHMNKDEHVREQLNNVKPQGGNSQPAQQMASLISNALQEKQATSPSDPSSKGKNVRPKHHPTHHHVLTGSSIKGREFEDPAVKAHMKAMAARALWCVAKGNVSICRSITESRALLCFAMLLEKGTDEVKHNSAMAVMEITAMAEENMDLRKTAFKPTTPAAKAILDQLLNVATKANSKWLIPCIKSLGHLARTFQATDTRIIEPLVKLIDENEPEVMLEAVITLVKFACSANYLCATHCKTIIGAGGVKHLIQLVYFGEQMVQIPALVLLCYIAWNVPESEVLAQEEVLIVLEWAAKQAHMNQDPALEVLLPQAKARLELYQSRGSRGFV